METGSVWDVELVRAWFGSDSIRPEPGIDACRRGITNNDPGKIVMPLIEEDVRFVRRNDRRDPEDCGIAAIVPFIAYDSRRRVVGV